MGMIIYTAADCPICKDVAQKMSDRGIPYSERLIDPYLEGEMHDEPDVVDLMVAFCKYDGDLPIVKSEGKFLSREEILEYLEKINE